MPPVGFQDSLGQPGDRDGKFIFRFGGEVLDTLIYKCHERRQLVCSRAQPGLQDGNDPLTECQRVDRVIDHPV